MSKSLNIAVALSALVHIGVISILVYYGRPDDVPFGDGIISVEVIGEGGAGGSLSAPPAGFSTAVKRDWRDRPGRPTAGAPSDFEAPGGNDGTESAGAGQSSGGAGPAAGSKSGNPILSKIRSKIERSKYYPPDAKRRKIEGRPEVAFEIGQDGSIASVSVTKSSGSRELDEAAVKTIYRSAPLPYYSGRISLAIRFSIGN